MIYVKFTLKRSILSCLRVTVTGAFALVAGLHAGFAQTSGTGPEISAEAATADQPIFIMPRSGPFSPQTVAVPNARVIAAWARSGHSDSSSEAFRHWDEDGVIPPNCATCHSGAGFRSLHGLDGSAPGLPENPVPVGGVVDCDTCHSPELGSITEVSLPSGLVHPVSGADAACTTCHQGRSAGNLVAAAIADKPLDTPDTKLRFMNPHYAVAASTNLGGYGGMGYQYPDQSYSGRFLHAKPVASCVSCHDPHTLEIAEPTCLTCHETGDPALIRVQNVSFDGSGKLSQGISRDIEANAELLMTMIKAYTAEVLGTPIVYDGAHYPYFYADTDGDGRPDTADGRGVQYPTWSPRLVRTVYNWKFVTADHGIHAHNPPYALELLYDSIADLSEPLDRDITDLGILR